MTKQTMPTSAATPLLASMKDVLAISDRVKSSWDLCGSRWNNTEAETIAFQTIKAAALNAREHGDAFYWQGTGTKGVSGGGLADNPNGMRSLIDDQCIVVEPYQGGLSEPDDIVHDEYGRPMVIRLTARCLEYVASMLK